ncbi:Btz domain-containing protein [Haematococcus lacustris]|uniref:Btz domain-containing protein n=1 Tax=Haematococcus lacustris TaxID=44745 RepID=A0A699YZ49_HAELA|nr:Btz domain-containing protein [Haematococcus lacustris]
MGDEPVEAISAPDAAAATIDESSLRVEDLLPKRRQRASDDESEDEAHHGTHDKAEASCGRDHAVSAIENQTDFVPTGGDDLQRDDSSQVPGEAEGDDSQDAVSDNEQEGEQEDAQQPAAQPPKPRQPYDVPTTGAFWLHDDRFSEAEAAAHQAKLAEDRVKAKAKEPEGKWAHDRFGVEDDADDNESHFRSRPNYRGLRGGRAGGRGRGVSSQAHHQDGMGMPGPLTLDMAETKPGRGARELPGAKEAWRRA